jgi:hypothetical protein
MLEKESKIREYYIKYVKASELTQYMTLNVM